MITSTECEIALEIAIRLFLFYFHLKCEKLTPISRVLQPEEMWLYRYPHLESYVHMSQVWAMATVLPCVLILCWHLRHKCRRETYAALASLSLAVTLNSALTSLIKLLVGRPRPSFLARCYPSGLHEGDCRGDPLLVMDGRKSFPSGHSSVSFASFTFMSLYLAAKMQLLSRNTTPRYTAASLVLAITPLVFALCIAISRTCDYHHHWQDVCVGSLLGISVSLVSYFQYFPSLYNEQCQFPLTVINEQQAATVSSNNVVGVRVKEV